MAALVAPLPLKPMKPADVGGAVTHVLHERGRLDGKPASPATIAAARDLQVLRDQLMNIDRLTYSTAEDAAAQFMRYSGLLAALELRFELSGNELGVGFQWKDAWRNKSRATFNDLRFERVCVLCNAAAAYSYCASQSQARGPAAGGLKDAARLFQQAAGCLNAAHDITKPLIWGLSPKWDPNALTVDLRLEMLTAMRDLMLAHAQRTFYEKACGENLNDGVKAKLAAAAATQFATVCSVFRSQPALAQHIEGESSMFKSADKTFLGRIEALRGWMDAAVDEHAAQEKKSAYE